MLDVTLTVTLKLIAPVVSRATEIGTYGVDVPMARSADNHYCLPRTLIKGRLRQSWNELRSVDAARFTGDRGKT